MLTQGGRAGIVGVTGRSPLKTLTLFLACGLVGPMTAQSANPVVDIGDRRELFVDRALIDQLDGVRLELARPRDAGSVFTFDRSWEGPFCGYATVIRDGQRLLLYYRGLPTAGGDGTDLERTCVAICERGHRFVRPSLSKYEVAGAERNNVVLAGEAPVSHNFSPFLDTRVTSCALNEQIAS